MTAPDPLDPAAVEAAQQAFELALPSPRGVALQEAITAYLARAAHPDPDDEYEPLPETPDPFERTMPLGSRERRARPDRGDGVGVTPKHPPFLGSRRLTMANHREWLNKTADEMAAPDPVDDAAAVDALVREVSSRLQWNLDAYGKVWTGEDEDTRFIVGPLLDEIRRLRDAR